MALRRRGGSGEAMNPWPGYVDALSTLLMVIIFVLLVFVLAQAFLSVALSGRDRALDRVNRQMTELADMLALEKGRTTELQTATAALTRDLLGATAARDSLAQQLAALRTDQDRIAADRDSLRSERDRLTARLADTTLQIQSAQARGEQLQTQLAEAARRQDATAQQSAATAVQLTASQKALTATQAELAATRASTAAQLAATRQQLEAAAAKLAEMQKQSADLDRTVQADRATIAARLSDLAAMTEQTRALTALRDELEKQARDAAANTLTEQQKRAAVAAQLAEEQKLGASNRAQLALLTRQIDELHAQLAQVSTALDAAEKSGADKDAQIVNLGSRLNSALAQKVEELQRYRSDFFGRLRDVLANRPGIQVVGDRFVFQSEVLFPVGSADLSPTGADEIKTLASTLLGIASQIPKDVNWLMRVDGHADRQPVQSSRFPSNWELSAARAITVVKLLVAEGVPAERLAATGFGDNQPLDAGTSNESYARNRRIELRLTDR